MSIIGYARTSTTDQAAGLADQVTVLEQAGCERIWQEHISALSPDRPELTACLAYLREGDTFVVTKPDRLARSVVDMLNIINRLRANGVTVRILSMGVDTGNPTGKLMLTVLGGVAEWEREIMLERQRAGIAEAKAAGKYKGRKPKMTAAVTAEARRMIEAGQGQASVARFLQVDPSTLWRALKAAAE